MYIYINVLVLYLYTSIRAQQVPYIYRCEVDYRDIPPILLRCKLCHASLLLWEVTWTRRSSPFPPLRTSNTARSCRMLWWWSTPLPTPPAAVPCACCTSQPPPVRTTGCVQGCNIMYKIGQTWWDRDATEQEATSGWSSHCPVEEDKWAHKGNSSLVVKTLIMWHHLT